MEEPTVDAKHEGDVLNIEDIEEGTDEETSAVEAVVDHGKIEITEVGNISDTGESYVSEMKEKEEMRLTDPEVEHEYKKQEDILDQIEESHGTEEPKKEEALEFVKKKKPEPKLRRVDMDIYYPDESKISVDENMVEKKVVESETEGGTQDIEDSDELIDPNKDYSVVDPSFLDEFLSSEEEKTSEAKKIEAKKMAEGHEGLIEEEEDDFQQEIYVQPPDREPSDRIYDQICDLETPLSSDESFKVPRFRYIPRRRSHPTQGYKMEDNKWLPQTQSVQSMDVPSTALLNLMENIAPALKKTLIEIGTYQPLNAVYYMTHSLLLKSKTPEEIGLEPDPHLIQLIVDGQKKKKKTQTIPILKKSDEIFGAPYAESHISTPHIEIKPDTPIKSDDENQSELQKFQRKYRKAKKEIMTEEKAKRSNLDPRTFLPGSCLGPTSLPLSADVASKKVKIGSPKAY